MDVCTDVCERISELGNAGWLGAFVVIKTYRLIWATWRRPCPHLGGYFWKCIFIIAGLWLNKKKNKTTTHRRYFKLISSALNRICRLSGDVGRTPNQTEAWRKAEMARFQKWLNNSSSKGAVRGAAVVCGLQNEVELPSDASRFQWSGRADVRFFFWNHAKSPANNLNLFLLHLLFIRYMRVA